MAPFKHIHLIIAFILSKKRHLRSFSLLFSIYFLYKQRAGWIVPKPHPQQKAEHCRPNRHLLLASRFFAIVSRDLPSSHIMWVSWKTKDRGKRPPLTSGQRETERMRRVYQAAPAPDLQMLRKDGKTVHPVMGASLCPGSSPHFFTLTAAPQDSTMKEKYNYGCFLRITRSF